MGYSLIGEGGKSPVAWFWRLDFGQVGSGPDAANDNEPQKAAKGSAPSCVAFARQRLNPALEPEG